MTEPCDTIRTTHATKTAELIPLQAIKNVKQATYNVKQAALIQAQAAMIVAQMDFATAGDELNTATNNVSQKQAEIQMCEWMFGQYQCPPPAL
jgi:hypothetical protein